MVYLFRGVGYNCDFVAEAMAEVTFKNLVTFVFSTKFFKKRNKSLLLNRNIVSFLGEPKHKCSLPGRFS